MQPDRGKTFAHQALQVTCFVNFLSFLWEVLGFAQSLTTTSNDRPLWLSRTSLKSNSKSMEPKNTELAKKKTVFNTFEYGYFWKFADTVTSLKRSNNWSTWIQLMCFFACHCLHLCRRLNIWKNPEVFDLIPIYNRFMIDGHPLPQRCNRHSRWHFPSKVAISGKCLRMREKKLQSKDVVLFKDIWYLKDEKNGAASGFSACFKHQGLSNPKLHWCCAGGTIHRWGLDSIKKIASCCRRSGATGSFYIPKTLQICILILHHHTSSLYSILQYKGSPFPCCQDGCFLRPSPWAAHLPKPNLAWLPLVGRHDKRWKTNLWGKEVIRIFLSKGD